MRRMRGDNYGILRAALCQMIMKKLPLPSASEAIHSISRCLAGGGDWIREWTFGHRLPYGPSNVVQGINLCLETLERLVIFKLFSLMKPIPIFPIFLLLRNKK